MPIEDALMTLADEEISVQISLDLLIILTRLNGASIQCTCHGRSQEATPLSSRYIHHFLWIDIATSKEYSFSVLTSLLKYLRINRHCSTQGDPSVPKVYRSLDPKIAVSTSCARNRTGLQDRSPLPGVCGLSIAGVGGVVSYRVI